MKLKKTATLLALAASALPALAQYEGTTVHERIGHGQDSIDFLNNYSLFIDAYKAKNYNEAYEPWKIAIQKGPMAQMSLYTTGAYTLEQLSSKATDAAKKKQYFDDLMALFDQQTKNVDALNSSTKPKLQKNKGTILCRKAFDYATYGPGVEPSYSLDNAYNMFTEGINLVNEDDSKEVEGYVLNKYFDVSYQKFKADPNFREQFIKDYMTCKEVCEKMLAKANDEADSVAAQQVVSQYDPTLLSVENKFAESKAADRTQLIAMFGPKIEQKKTDLPYLKSVIRVLAANDCDDTDAYFKASRYAFDIEPSYESAIGIAQSNAKLGKTTEAITYYNKALELSQSDKQKGNIALTVAYALAKKGSYTEAFSYLDKASQFNPTLAGKCYLFRAQCLAVQKKFDEAASYASKAASQDPSISGKAIRLRDNILDVKRKNAEYERQSKLYNEQKAKQQRMDNFWNCK